MAAVGVVCALLACGCGSGTGIGCSGGVYTDGACIPNPAVYTSRPAQARPDGPLWFLGGDDPGSQFGRSGALYHVASPSDRLTRVPLPKRVWSVTGLAASPNGHLIVLSNGGGEFPPRNLYVMHSDGTEVRQITRGNFYDIDPAWSPDSRWIVFSSSRCCATATSTGTYALYAVRPGGSHLHELHSDRGGSDIAPAWSPDGTRIAYVRMPTHNQAWSVWVMNADGTVAHSVTRDQRLSDAVAWSPTGHQLAYTSHLIDNRDWQVRVIPAEGGRPHPVFTCSAPCRTGGYTIAWSPDGRQIAFTVISQPLLPHQRPRLALVSASGGAYRLVPTRAAAPTGSSRPEGRGRAVSPGSLAFGRNVAGRGEAAQVGGFGFGRQLAMNRAAWVIVAGASCGSKYHRTTVSW
jgi:dipeptidyl aminopeptidase/acylaminoacyl peptidase